jgi:hypothetical protein
MKPTLIPCPFCGDAMQLWDQDTHARHIGDNGKCPLRHHAVMVDVWNTRAAPAKSPRAAPLQLSAGGLDQRPILGQRGVGLRAEPERRFVSDPPRPGDPVPDLTYLGQPEDAVPDDYGFCRECGSPMKIEVAAETRVLCSACGWTL